MKRFSMVAIGVLALLLALSSLAFAVDFSKIQVCGVLDGFGWTSRADGSKLNALGDAESVSFSNNGRVKLIENNGLISIYINNKLIETVEGFNGSANATGTEIVFDKPNEHYSAKIWRKKIGKAYAPDRLTQSDTYVREFKSKYGSDQIVYISEYSEYSDDPDRGYREYPVSVVNLYDLQSGFNWEMDKIYKFPYDSRVISVDISGNDQVVTYGIQDGWFANGEVTYVRRTDGGFLGSIWSGSAIIDPWGTGVFTYDYYFQKYVYYSVDDLWNPIDVEISDISDTALIKKRR